MREGRHGCKKHSRQGRLPRSGNENMTRKVNCLALFPCQGQEKGLRITHNTYLPRKPEWRLGKAKCWALEVLMVRLWVSDREPTVTALWTTTGTKADVVRSGTKVQWIPVSHNEREGEVLTLEVENERERFGETRNDDQ